MCVCMFVHLRVCASVYVCVCGLLCPESSTLCSTWVAKCRYSISIQYLYIGLQPDVSARIVEIIDLA